MARQKQFESRPFHSTEEEIKHIKPKGPPGLENIPHYHLAFFEEQFLLRDELRPVRLQLELLRPELILQDHHIEETIVFFGSARTPEESVAKQRLADAEQALSADPSSAELQQAVTTAKEVIKNSAYLNEATKLAERVSTYKDSNFVVVTGGGPGVMRAANKGAHQAGKQSVALGVMLPNEQEPNEFVTPNLTFQFHYFAIRKMHFLMRAKALIAFPGGFGTLDELFETLTLIQTTKMDRIPLILFRREFWNKVINFQALVDEGMVSPKDLDLFHIVETADEAWDIIQAFYA